MAKHKWFKLLSYFPYFSLGANTTRRRILLVTEFLANLQLSKACSILRRVYKELKLNLTVVGYVHTDGNTAKAHKLRTVHDDSPYDCTH